MANPFTLLHKSRKGFYLVSPFLGFFFFLITVSVGMVMITENNQMIETSKSTVSQQISFVAYAIQADAFDVFLQNYLQANIDSYEVGNPDEGAIKTQIEDTIGTAMNLELKNTYEALYHNAFKMDCNTTSTAYSGIYIRMNSMGVDILGSGRIFSINPDNGKPETAILPYVSRYGLTCRITEPPAIASTIFLNRWYYINADCICCQCLGFSACDIPQQYYGERPVCPFCPATCTTP